MKYIKTWVSMAGTILGMAFWPFPATADQHNSTVASLDYCADQFVLLLGDRDQIISVSNTAEENFSFYRERAQGIPKNKSSIEEIIMIAPDIAVQTYTAAARMGEMTERSEITLFTTAYGSDPETVAKNITALGDLIGQSDRAQEFSKKYLSRLSKLKSNPQLDKTMAYITPGGVTAGDGTSVDDIIKLAGFKNYATENGYKGWVNIPIENLVLDPPDLFITSFYDRTTSVMSNWSLSRHNYLKDMMETTPTINLPSSHMSCNGLFLVDAAELIREGAEEFNLMDEVVK